MKFKYIGPNNMVSPDLVIYNIMSKEDKLANGQVLEVPDANLDMIERLNTSGLFEKVISKSTSKKVKNNQKKER